MEPSQDYSEGHTAVHVLTHTHTAFVLINAHRLYAKDAKETPDYKIKIKGDSKRNQCCMKDAVRSEISQEIS